MKNYAIPATLASLSVFCSHVWADTTHQRESHLEQIDVTAAQPLLLAAKSYSIASDGDLRDRVNLGLLGRANAFTSPITVVNYDEKIIDNKQPRTLVDLIANTDASTMAFGGETNTLQGLYVRGYQLNSRQFSVNGLAGMYSYQSSPTVAVNSAQLIKGASSAISGMDPEGAVSGAVNIETKKATDKPITKIGVGYFSDSRVSGTVDLGRRFGDRRQFGIRVNANIRDGDTPRRGFSENNQEFAVNADYRGERLRVAFDGMYSKRKTTGSRARFQDLQTSVYALPAAPDGKTNLVPSWQKQTTVDKTAMLTFEYDSHYNMQLSGGVGYSESAYFGNLAALTLLDGQGNYCIGTGVKNGKCVANRGARSVDNTAKTISMNLTARGEFDWGAVSHTWSAAFDRVSRARLIYWGKKYTNTVTTNIYHPDFSSAKSNISPVNSPAGTDASYTAYSLALSDTLGFVDNHYRLTLGGRLQWVNQKNHLNKKSGKEYHFSPMLMMAWVPNPNLVVYGNYMEDLEPGEISPEDGSMYAPRVSRQIEVGIRKNWGHLVTSFNAFQITRPGSWRGNKIKYLVGKEQGEERNRGVEFTIYTSLLNQTLRTNLGMMYMQSSLINYPNYQDQLINGTQVSVPRFIAKAGIEWDTPFIQGLTLNAHLQYYGKSYQKSDKSLSFPSYAIVDVGASYSTKLQGHTLRLSGAVENLFNKNYWQVQRGKFDRSFAVLGMPRTFWVKAEYSF